MTTIRIFEPNSDEAFDLYLAPGADIEDAVTTHAHDGVRSGCYEAGDVLRVAVYHGDGVFSTVSYTITESGRVI